MFKYRKVVRRWKSWSLPTRLGLSIAVIVAILGIIGFPTIKDLINQSIKPKVEISISTEGINPIISEMKSIPLSEIKKFRNNKIIIENTSKILIKNVLLRCQFPEAIYRIVNTTMHQNIQINSKEFWDAIPMVTDGNISLNDSIELLDNQGKTGLWSVAIDNIPALSEITLNFISSNETSTCLYNKWAKEKIQSLPTSTTMWYLECTYQYIKNENIYSNENLIFNLTYDANSRIILIKENIENDRKKIDLLKVRQAKGFRVPGYFQTKGYIISESSHSPKEFMAPIMYEDTSGISTAFGFLGSSLEPSYIISYPSKK